MILLVERKELNQKKVQLMPSVQSCRGSFYLLRRIMKLILLSQEFYDKYGHCKEILQKPSRPYISVEICIDGILYAIPLRHHIRHNNAFITKGESGLDFTKSIVIESNSFISDSIPWIESADWNIIKKSQNKIIYAFKKFLNQYKRALLHPDNPRSYKYIRYCSLQYFDI